MKMPAKIDSASGRIPLLGGLSSVTAAKGTAAMQVLHEGLADSKYRPCPLLVKYVEAGWLGRKSQRGFYDYRGDKPIPTR